MGRIKSLMVKRAAKQLIGNPELVQAFNEDFTVNKKALGSLMPSKPIRNKIAGYIARLKKAEKIQKLAAEKPAVKPISA
ncbi:MAG: 30S ribosomal protein S17e [Nanoarchaeota archaeon]|nr:30S ribosomal protein S17e [Nanoarchaeota archaeon]